MKAEVCAGRVTLTAQLLPMGEDWCLVVTGGDRPHLGCAAVAVPHPGISDPSMPSATVSTLNLPGHRDDHLANRIAKTLSAGLGRSVAVLCGVHFDSFSPEMISDGERAADELCRLVLERGGAQEENPA